MMEQTSFESEIQGAWKGFTIRLVDLEQDLENIQDFLRVNFHPDEPLGTHCPPDEGYVEMSNLKITKILETCHHLSLIAIDTVSGDIAGVQLQFAWTLEQARERKPIVTRSPFFQRVVLDSIHERLDPDKLALFSKFGVTTVVWNFVAGTSKAYRGQGLASELYRRMVTLVKSYNYSVIFSLFTSPFTRRCAEKVGFVETARTKFSDHIDPSTGLPFLPLATGAEDFGSIMALHIQ